MKSDTHSSPGLRWDIFCRVIDNHGDLGVCWRLCADLAQRGHVRAPVGRRCIGLGLDGTTGLWCRRSCVVRQHCQALAQDATFQIGDVVVEAFGCELPEAFQALMVQGTSPVWINLEYLSAEGYVARSHGLASPVMSGPARG